MTTTGVTVLCLMFLVLMCTLCWLAHVLDENDILRKRLKDMGK